MGERLQRIALFVVVVAVHVFQIARHDIWRDEAESWTLASSQPTPWDVWLEARYQGHTFLWNLLAWIVSRFDGSVVGLKVLHALLVAAVTAALIASFWHRRSVVVAVLASYYFAFEYAAICRPYILSALFVIGACRFLHVKRPVLLAVCIALLANTAPHAMPLCVWLSFEGLRRGVWPSGARAVPFVVVGAGVLAAFATVATAAGTGDPKTFEDLYHHFPTYVIGAVAPVPSVPPQWWNNIAFFLAPTPIVLAVVALCAWLMFEALRRDWLQTAGLALCILTTCVIYKASGAGTLRHVGHTYLLLVGAMLLDDDGAVARVRISRAVIHGAQALSAAAAIVLSSMTPFSMSTATAQWLQRDPKALAAAACVDPMACVCLRPLLPAPLDAVGLGPQPYYRRGPALKDAILARNVPAAIAERLRTQPELLLILEKDMGPAATSQNGVTLEQVAAFTGSASGDDFYVYRAHRAAATE